MNLDSTVDPRNTFDPTELFYFSTAPHFAQSMETYFCTNRYA